METMIPLSPVDHIFTGAGSYPIEFVFKYDGRLDENRMRSSLKEALFLFPAMDSRLAKINDYSYGLNLNAKGCQFEISGISQEFEDKNKQYLFIDPVETVENEPLAKIRLTHTHGGSVLGISISHAIGDGFSYFYFLSGWAKIFHGQQVILPANEREKLIPSMITGHKNITRDEFSENTGLFIDEKRKTYSRENLHWDTRNYPDNELKSMVTDFQAGINSRLSFNDIIAALLWKEYILQWRKQDDPEITFCSCPVDFRRIVPGFPKNYFGNAVSMATYGIEFKELQETGIPRLANQIRAVVSGINPEQVSRSLEILEAIRKQEGLQVTERIHVMHPRSGLLVTNLSRLPLNEIIFNCGPPVDYNILTTAQRGAVILPGKEGLEVRICYPG